MLLARSPGTLSSIAAGGLAVKYSGKSPAPSPGWSDMYLDMDLNLHTIVSWRAAACGSVLRSVDRNIFSSSHSNIFDEFVFRA